MFLLPPPPLYILVYKNEIRKKKDPRPPDWLLFLPTRHTGNDFFLLKGGLI